MEIDWVQAQLNDWSYCFSVSNDGTFCGRASYWFGHPEDHEFETLDDYLSFRREDSRWISSKLVSKCERLEAQLSRVAPLIEAAKLHMKDLDSECEGMGCPGGCHPTLESVRSALAALESLADGKGNKDVP